MGKKHQILEQLDQGNMSASLFAMGMASDAQEALSRGHVKLANDILNNLKIVIDERLSVKDLQGRHAEINIPESFAQAMTVLSDLRKCMRKDLYGGNGHIVDGTDNLMGPMERAGVVEVYEEED